MVTVIRDCDIWRVNSEHSLFRSGSNHESNVYVEIKFWADHDQQQQLVANVYDTIGDEEAFLRLT